MSLFTFLSTTEIDDKLEDAEISLTAADDEEAKSLPLHNSRCQKRFRYTVLRLNRIDRKLLLLSFLVGIQLLLTILSSDKALAIVHRIGF